MPTLIAICAAATVSPLSVTMCCVLLVIVVVMQSAVNTFNDYYDYVKGTDSEDAYVDESDAVLVYNDINPRSALMLAIGMLVVAFALGSYAIMRAGIVPLVIALIGALFVVLYSAGKSPISYLPLGEAVSGVVMGGLIPLAVYQVITSDLNFFVLIMAVPTIIGVGLIMFTNNTCDIERDIPAGRKTLAVVLGRGSALAWYHLALLVWILFIILNTALWFRPGLIVMPFMILASYPLLKALLANPLTPDQRLRAMPQILSINIVLGAFYACAMLASTTVSLVL